MSKQKTSSGPLATQAGAQPEPTKEDWEDYREAMLQFQDKAARVLPPVLYGRLMMGIITTQEVMLRKGRKFLKRGCCANSNSILYLKLF
jgi:hypothetical protein